MRPVPAGGAAGTGVPAWGTDLMRTPQRNWTRGRTGHQQRTPLIAAWPALDSASNPRIGTGTNPGPHRIGVPGQRYLPPRKLAGPGLPGDNRSCDALT
jgi:hypothetical protein